MVPGRVRAGAGKEQGTMSTHAFIGHYTNAKYGIYHVVVTDDGGLELRGVSEDIDNPIYFAVNKAKDRLYVAQGDAIGGDRATNGAIAAYAIGGDLSLSLLSKRAMPFSVPCHISLDGAGAALAFAEYSRAHAGVIGLKADGSFEEGGEVVVQHKGRGPNPVRQEAAHAHCAVVSPDGRFLLVCDLGQDTVFAYDFASWRDGLRRVPEADISTAPGAGPRHLVFDAAGRFAYLVNELDSTVQSLAYDGARFTAMQTLSMLPPGFKGETKAAAIRLSPDGRWLLASNRGHDSIAAFSVGADGRLCETPAISFLTGHFPRDFAFVPGTDYVLCGHKLSDELALYRFDAATGLLARLPATLALERPLAIAFA